MVHLFDMLRLLMRYLGNFCQITAVMRLIWIWNLSDLFDSPCTGWVKQTDAFHIQISRKPIIAGIRLFPCEQPPWGGWWLQKYSSIQTSTIKMHFNSQMELHLCFKLINDSLIWYASFTNEIFGQLLSNYSRYAANLNMKAVSFFYSPCSKVPRRSRRRLCSHNNVKT